MGIGDRLREERERFGLSQEAMGMHGGVRKQAQHMYESGARRPDSDYLERIAAAGADVLYILTGQRSQPLASAPDEEMLMGAYRRASLAQKQAILGAAIGVAPPSQAVGNVSGGSVVQTAQGNGVVQIGKISGSKPRR